VLDDIREYAPATPSSTIAFLLSVVVGIPLGGLAAVRRDSWIDHVARFSPTSSVVADLLACLHHAGGLRHAEWAPGPGRIDAIAFRLARHRLLLIDCVITGDWDTFWDAAAHRPAVDRARTATLGLITRDARHRCWNPCRRTMCAWRAPRASRDTGGVGHALPNAMLPVVTLGGLAYANLLAGAVMTETVFSWPGLGRYTFRSAVTVDFPAIMAVTAIVAAIFVLVNFLVDMSYALLDPRVVKK
jgi:peptide/nickel transport system permease protein